MPPRAKGTSKRWGQPMKTRASRNQDLISHRSRRGQHRRKQEKM
jgi:hypothetical protein